MKEEEKETESTLKEEGDSGKTERWCQRW